MRLGASHARSRSAGLSKAEDVSFPSKKEQGAAGSSSAMTTHQPPIHRLTSLASPPAPSAPHQSASLPPARPPARCSPGDPGNKQPLPGLLPGIPVYVASISGSQLVSAPGERALGGYAESSDTNEPSGCGGSIRP